MAPLKVGVFDRRLDLDWRRSSYSSLVSGVDHRSAGVSSELETTELDDESPVTVQGVEAVDPLLQLPSPMSDLPGGASFGTLVHAILETADPTAADLKAELHSHTAEQVRRNPGPVTVAVDQLVESLALVLTTPLGPLAGDRRLADVARSDRLAELTFELPLTGGDRPAGHATVADLASLLARHLAPGDPMHPYADRLTAPELGWKPLRGYLTGSIDAVLRIDGPRYLIVDYKTNHLGEVGEPLTAWHYRPEVLAAAMIGSNYPLQALLYSAALHRFLRWRQPGYDPGEHLGGVLYLFVRGMCGPQTPVVDGTPCGVFGWRPPADLIVELSALLDRGAR